MRRVLKSLFSSVILIAVLLGAVGAAQSGFGLIPSGWQKMTGPTKIYAGRQDGIAGDRENSYAWSMEVMGDYLYVGTSRDVLAPMMLALGANMNTWPEDLPMATDMRGRIFRMKLKTGQWEQVYLCDPVSIPGQPILGADLGYRMMKVSKVGSPIPMLYVGGIGQGVCRLLAVGPTGITVPIFAAMKPNKIMSIRAITEHAGMLFWASEDASGPAIWCSANPLADAVTQNFTKITIPSNWFTRGCEVWDMVSYNNTLYVFLTPYDKEQLGFWCAKLKKTGSTWSWQLVVGDKTLGAKYAPGMGLQSNGAGVPFVFKNKCYVGTMDATAIRMMNETGGGSGPPPNPEDAFKDATGMQIYRFDTRDKWERVMPAAQVTNPDLVGIAGGFANPLNRYIWRFGVHNNMLYAGTFDARTMMDAIKPLVEMPEFDWWNPAGFDLYCSPDGNAWVPVTVDGFVDKFNYGARSFATDPKSGDMFLGTANPFYGCQVWKKKK